MGENLIWCHAMKVFIFFYEKENEPKEIARVMRAALCFSNRAVAVELADAQTATAPSRPIL